MVSSKTDASVEDHDPKGQPKVQQNTQQDSEPELPKVWNIEDPFQYAPTKPDEDPWTLLLEPLLKNDKMRCDAWTDEVQNLLIFAGLFSGVVTAFIVESYKNLQPGPNDAMINLLALIATRLDSQPNSTTNPFQVPEQFLPDASAIRVNIFWFISLVLSLTTVLVGIISLQWLREHQSYPDLSPREAYAVFHMRAEGMRIWQVDRIFTAMPLLLQCALILFLGGIIDFLHAFRQWAVVIPVTVVIGLPLVFLGSTTILPALQTFSLYIHFPSKSERWEEWPTPPAQCPYKSPQSHAVRAVSKPLCALLDHLYERLKPYSFQGLWFHVTHPFSNRTFYEWYKHENFPYYIYSAALGSKWVHFDKSWLIIRDAYMRRALGRSACYQYIGHRSDFPPIYDITMALTVQKYQKSTSATAYHGLSTLSEAALRPIYKSDLIFSTPTDRLRQNDYLYDLLSFPGNSSLSKFINLDSCFDEDEKENYVPTKVLTSILHQQNLLAFTDGSEGLSTHRKELALRFFRHFYEGQHEMRLSNIKLKLPECLTFMSFDEFWPRSKDPDLCDEDLFEALAWQVANLTLSIFRQFDGEFHPHSLVHNPFAQNIGLPFYMEIAGHIALKALSPPAAGSSHRPSGSITLATRDILHAIFTYIDQSLNGEISSWSDGEGQPSLIFYLAACYTHQLTTSPTNDPFFSDLRDTMCKYKKRTIDSGKIDSVIEKRLRTDFEKRSYMYSDYHTPFSPRWWNAFEIPDPAEPVSDPYSVRTSPASVVYYPFEAP